METEGLLPPLDRNGRYRYPDGSYVWEYGSGWAATKPEAKILRDEDWTIREFLTASLAAEALAAEGYGPPSLNEG